MYSPVYRINDQLLDQVLAVYQELWKRRIKLRNEAYRLDAGKLSLIHNQYFAKFLREVDLGRVRSEQIEVGYELSSYSPPPGVEIEYQLTDLLKYLNEEREVNPLIKAAVVDLELGRIQPFVYGSDKVGNLVASELLSYELSERLGRINLDSYFENNKNRYEKIRLRAYEVGELTGWVEFFVEAVLTEVKKIEYADEAVVGKIQRDEAVELSERQQRLVSFLSLGGEAVMKDLRAVLPKLSEDTVLRELNKLIAMKVVVKKGQTKQARYTLK